MATKSLIEPIEEAKRHVARLVRFSEYPIKHVCARLPEHLPRVVEPAALVRLYAWSCYLRSRYRVPIYLCGSALDPGRTPRDIDIRLRLENARFQELFEVSARQWTDEGETGEWGAGRLGWSNHCSAVTWDAWELTGLNIDFQIYPAFYWRHYTGRPRLRLDTLIR